jgi:hypothetical protein
MVMRPRHALAAAAILAAITLSGWAALSTDRGKPAPHAAAQEAAPVTTAPAGSPDSQLGVPRATMPSKPEAPKPRSCTEHPAGLPSGAGRISTVAGDFDGDQAGDQLVAYAKLDATGQPSQWHLRIVLASGGITDLGLANSPDWIGPNGLAARRAVDANGDGRDEGFVTSTGGASNDAYNLFGLDGCQLRQVRVAGAEALQFRVGASVGHAEGFDCQGTDRHGRRLLVLWGVERADQQPDGGSAYTYTKTSYRWATSTLVRQVDTDHGGFTIIADGVPMPTSDPSHDLLPAEFTKRCGGGAW